ncbi:MAG: zinc-binding dehydrogenase, partial [Pseudomonadota bacterium]
GALRVGTIKADVGQRYALSDAAEAHRALEARQTMGSTVLLPDGVS